MDDLPGTAIELWRVRIGRVGVVAWSLEEALVVVAGIKRRSRTHR